MKSAVLITFGLVLASMLIASEAAAQGCKEGCAPCVVGGKKGTRCCENGKLSACIPDLDREGGPRFAAARSGTFAPHRPRPVGTASARYRTRHRPPELPEAQETCRLTSSGAQPIPMDFRLTRIGVAAPTRHCS